LKLNIDPKDIPPITHSNEVLKQNMLKILENVIAGATSELKKTEAQLREAINVWSSKMEKPGQ
jgi:hypothetical protein